MLAADHRLRDSDAFRRTVTSGRRAGGAALVLHLLVDDSPDPSGRPARVGFVVSKAVGKAVSRNRVRRRLRHLVMTHLSSLPTSSQLVVRALPPAAGMTSAELGVELVRCLQRVRPVVAPRSSAARAGAAAAAGTEARS